MDVDLGFLPRGSLGYNPWIRISATFPASGNLEYRVMKAKDEKPMVFYAIPPLDVIAMSTIPIILALGFFLAALTPWDMSLNEFFSMWTVYLWFLLPLIALHWCYTHNAKYALKAEGLDITVGSNALKYTGHSSMVIPRGSLLGLHTIILGDEKRNGLFFKDREGDTRYVFIFLYAKQLDGFKDAFGLVYPEAKIPEPDKASLIMQTIGNKVGEIRSISRRKRILAWAIPSTLIGVAIFWAYYTNLMYPPYLDKPFQLITIFSNLKLMFFAGVLLLLVALNYLCVLFLILIPFRHLLSSRVIIEIYEKGILPPKGESTPVVIRWGDILSIDIRRFITGVVINYYDPSHRKRKIYIQGYIRESDLQELRGYIGTLPT